MSRKDKVDAQLNWRLIAIDVALAIFPVLAELTVTLNPYRSVFIRAFERPVTFWLFVSNLGFQALTLLLYPISFFVVICLLARQMNAGRWETIGSILVFTVSGQVITPFLRQILLTSSALQEPRLLWELTAPNLPFFVFQGSVYEVVIALGAVALPRLMAEWSRFASSD